MQTAQQTPPPVITIVGADGKPQTLNTPSSTKEVQQLIAQREELEDQLEDVGDRRTGLGKSKRLAESATPER